jgi:hypothetical protein
MAKRKTRDPARKAFQLRPQARKYPIATIAYYGPDDRTATKIAVGIVDESQEVIAMERWYGPDVLTNREVKAGIDAFITKHKVSEVAITDGILGCPHEEGIDFPEGEECPHCPFWRGKQGINVRRKI